jgi:Fe2+ transport system protein FeoA
VKLQPIALTDLSRDAEAQVVHVDASVAGRLSAFGLYPGVRVRILQRFPGLVVKTEETEVALERRVARLVAVVPWEGEGS